MKRPSISQQKKIVTAPRRSLKSKSKREFSQDSEESDRQKPKYPRNPQRYQLIYKVSFVLCLISFLLTIAGIILYRQDQNQRIQEAKQNTKREALSAVLEIDRELREYQQPALTLASLPNLAALPEAELLREIESEIANYPHLIALGAAHTFFARDPDTMLYAPGFLRTKQKLQKIQLEDYYNYTKPQYAWFRNTLSREEYWGEPYFWPENSAIDEPIFGFYVPYYQTNNDTTDIEERIPQGIIYAEYSFKRIRKLINSLNLGRTGYAFLVSKEGTFIVHPHDEKFNTQNKIIDFLQTQNNTSLIDLANQSLAGEAVETEFIDGITGQKSWLFLQPIELNGWVVGVVFLEQEILLDSDSRRQRLISISLAAIAFLFFLSILWLRLDRITTKKLWALSSFSTLLLLVEIGFVWRLALSDRNYLSDRILLLNQGELDNFISTEEDSESQFSSQDILTKIPTGIFFQSIRFSDSNEVFITAYIWQKYTDGIHDNLSRGFILPDSVDANDLEISEAYRYKQNGIETIGWYVETTLRQGFDLSQYPFDRKDISLQIWHQDLDRQVILVPDLEAYPLINPRVKPGINRDLVLEGWTLESSFFEYKFREYDTNFGFTSGFAKENLPDLYFTITTKRKFIDPLISKLVGLICVVVLLFVMLVILDEDRSMEVLGVAAGLIFIVIVDQISLRESIVAKGLIYFDYFYFIIYLFISFVGVNALLLLKKNLNLPLVNHEDTLPAQLLYWPSLLGVLLLLTILTFY
jgi:type II secretory pathway pseudopilin PulG